MTKIQLDVVSDVMCPWCYIGKRRLEQALAELGGDGEEIEIELRWRPFQLDPTLPQEGRDRREYLEKKFGGPERAKEIYERIRQAGLEEGLEFNFDAIEVSPNTIDAHRVIRWASNEGQEIQDKLVERLFKDFFMDGAHLGKHEVLVDAARAAGMDESIVAALLATDQDREAVSQEIAVAQQMGVTGVPCFIIDNKYAVMGAQPADQIVGAIKQAAQMKQVGAPGTSD
ncbi:MAG: DsbA family oxidoreductase [Rhizobiaceae bacterium]|nr:DsbA family oxidoreductase [Hyphomicrobiales bacterium]NRB32212.1 DsbA family oxidoreductase [Rhizobiaceae bacterium]